MPSSSTGREPADIFTDSSLQKIDFLANFDVEMQDIPSDQLTYYLVLDTNVLLSHLEVIQQFVKDAEGQVLPLKIVIPGAVIYELDRQKNRDGLAWFARRASVWLLKKVKERKMVKGQAQEETCKASKNWKIKEAGDDFGSERANDALILDCCRYFRTKGHTFLCSGDKILCVECEQAGIHTIQPSKYQWRSRDLAQAIFDRDTLLHKFSAYYPSYGPTSRDDVARHVDRRALPDGDGMDVDDDDAPNDVLHPSHALDLLHMQIIEHFTRLLLELVERVGGLEIRGRPINGAGLSRHAPRYALKDLSEWDAADCLEYLDSKKPRQQTSRSLDIFLSLPYKTPGARRGQDWPTQAWVIALQALASLGDLWEEPSIRDSLEVLQPHLSVFATKMRPTGM